MKVGTPLQELLTHALEQYADKTAIQSESAAITYGELENQTRRVAAGLLEHDIQPGDRVAWLLPNCLEAVMTTLACYRVGAVAVPLNYRYVAEEVGSAVERVSARVLVYDSSRFDTVRPILESESQLTSFTVGDSVPQSIDFDRLLASEPSHQRAEVASDAPALLLFTSGSTGRPKGVVHSHSGAAFGIDVSRRVFDFKAEDVVLVGKPISHAGGLQTQLMPTLQVGGTVVLARKPTPATAVEMIKRYSVTEYGLLASDLLDFIEYLEQNPTPLPSLNNSIGSGDAVPEDLHHRFRDLLGWEVMEGAGMTEVGGYYAANPRFGVRKWGSLGLPTPDTELDIVDDLGASCEQGQTGEIVIRSQSTTTGYWKDPEATAELYRNGWLHTGDLAHRDEDDYIWFVARKKLMIVRRGSNIAPAEVESVIDAHPSVHACVVVGITDPHDGQVPAACVSLLEGDFDAGAAERQLREYVKDHLAGYKNPEHYLFMKELPRSGTGKFDRHKLQQMAEQEFGQTRD